MLKTYICHLYDWTLKLKTDKVPSFYGELLNITQLLYGNLLNNEPVILNVCD